MWAIYVDAGLMYRGLHKLASGAYSGANTNQLKMQVTALCGAGTLFETLYSNPSMRSNAAYLQEQQ